jgi:hypothetical protein
MNIRVIHAISGRLRLRLPHLRNDPIYASQIEKLVKELDFVTSVRVNPLASSLVITHPKTLVNSEVESKLVAAIARLDAKTDLSSLPDTEYTSEKSTLQTEEIDHETVALTTNESREELIPQSEDLCSDEGTVTIPVESTPSPEESVEKAERIESPKPTANLVFPSLNLSQQALARRLGISFRALNILRSKPNFTQWSRTKDPEQIGWVYVKPLKKFYAVSSC